jgi:SCY1-like protein 1
MLVPLFFIEEHYQDPSKIGKEMAPLVSKLFLVPDRGVRSVLLNKVGFMTKQLEKSQLNSSVFEPMCSGFNDSSSALRELTLKATLELVPFLNSPNMEKLSRYLVRLQSDAEASIRTNSVIFISKIAPHLSEVSKQKMLLPAYSRAMNDGFAPCRLSALQAALQSKTLFTMKEVATKVMPCIMPLLLDPMADVRREAFRVVQLMLKELEEESKRMETMGVPGQPPQEGIPHQGTAPSTTGRTGPAPAPASGDSAGYLYGLSTWMAGTTTASTPASGAMSTTTTPTKPAVAPPIPTPVSTGAAPSSQPPVQQFASRSFGISAPAPAPVTAAANDGWGDEEDDGWGDDDDGADEDPFANIGAKPVSAAATVPSSFVKAPAPSAALGGFGGGMNDDPFASIGAKPTPVNARGSSGGKLVLPKKTNLAARKVAPPPATKLAVGDDEDLADGWDDF